MEASLRLTTRVSVLRYTCCSENRSRDADSISHVLPEAVHVTGVQSFERTRCATAPQRKRQGESACALPLSQLVDLPGRSVSKGRLLSG